jgi:uncharacterized protein YbdZ (MbtH family)
MNLSQADVEANYAVVVNPEEQYSIWPCSLTIPRGWKSIGMTGPKDECLKHIEETWQDMRPLSLRRPMNVRATEGGRQSPAISELKCTDISEDSRAGRPGLVEKLLSGRHPVAAAFSREDMIEIGNARPGRVFVRLRFTQTCGETELGIKLDRAASVFPSPDAECRQASVHLEGELILDEVEVRCIVDLDGATLRGDGFLVRLNERSNEH